MKHYWVYILTNHYNKVLYIGVANNLERRIYEHKNGLYEGFSKKYNLNKLVYQESYNDINQAISREKQLKGYKRFKKDDLVNEINPE